MGVTTKYPTKNNLIDNINNYVKATNGPTTITGRYLAWLFNAVANLLSDTPATAMWSGVISQSGIDIAPALVPFSDLKPGQPVQNTICYEETMLELSFVYLGIGHYRAVANIPIFGEHPLVGIVFSNNHFVEGADVTSMGEVKMLPMDPAKPYEFEFKTFDVLDSGQFKNDILTNCTLNVFRIE